MRVGAGWSWAWGTWLAATIGSFAWLEAAALRRRCHPTLSATLARWLGLNPRGRRGPYALAAFALGWTWLTVHVARWEPGRPEAGALVRLIEGGGYARP